MSEESSCTKVRERVENEKDFFYAEKQHYKTRQQDNRRRDDRFDVRCHVACDGEQRHQHEGRDVSSKSERSDRYPHGYNDASFRCVLGHRHYFLCWCGLE